MISLSLLCVHADVLKRCCVCACRCGGTCATCRQMSVHADVEGHVRRAGRCQTDMCACRVPETYVYHIDAHIFIYIYRIYARIYMYIYIYAHR
jgi:hypothetical protein